MWDNQVRTQAQNASGDGSRSSKTAVAVPAGESRGSAWGQHWALRWEAGLSVHLQIHFSSICADVLSGLNASTERARARAVNFVNKLLRSESTDTWTSQSSVSGSYFNSSIQEYVYPRNLIINQALMQNISTYLVWLKHTAHQPSHLWSALICFLLSPPVPSP